MSRMQRLLGPVSTLAEQAIELLRLYEDNAVTMHPDGYWVGDSGGKDSCVVKDLVRRSGVRATYHHNLTTVDPPECVRFVRLDQAVRIERPPESMAAIIRREGLPPRRNARFCCKLLKERGGAGRIVVTGVRWAESVRRTSRRSIESCYRDTTKLYLNPIIAWTDEDVWAYIRKRGLPYCSLYDEGWTRIGCILCPMKSNPTEVRRELERWPRTARLWERAIKATWRPATEAHGFTSPESYWQWWLWDRRGAAPASAGQAGQLVMFDDDGMEERDA